VDVHEKLDELSRLVEEARSMPMSASCIVNRAELLGVLEELRELLPEEFRHAQLLLDDREAVVDEGRREAQRIIAGAEVERDRLTSETEVAAAAAVKAEQLRLAAIEEAQTMRAEVDDYVDSKLANFEVVLDKTMAAVRRGRDKLRGRTEHDHFAGPHDDDFSHPLDDDEPLG
jgi:cell division septum initiation protein DivIVA